MQLIVFAHPLEAHSAIEALDAREVELGRLWRFEGGALLVTGMGIAAAGASVGKYAHGFSEIFNVGFAGSLQQHAIGKILEVGVCTKHLSLPDNSPPHCEKIAKKAHPPLSIGSGVRLLTSDYPIHSKEERAGLEAYDLVDMEGYGVALAAKRAEIPCKMFKVVSDSCEEGGWDQITDHLEELQKIVASLVRDEVLCKH